jgi:hypothetical protein
MNLVGYIVAETGSVGSEDPVHNVVVSSSRLEPIQSVKCVVWGPSPGELRVVV